MIWTGDITHGALIARAAKTGFDPEVDVCISRVSKGSGHFLGGVIYTGYTGSMIMMHMAGVSNWMTPELVWCCFDYPFMQLAVKQVMCTVGSNNLISINITKRLGFKHEHTIVDGIPHGDLLLFKMLREDCKWLRLRSRYLRVNGTGEHVHVHA